MRSLRSDEVVAAVVRWSDNHVMCDQRFERVLENRTRQVRAVAVESNSPSLMVSCEMRKHGRQPCSKTLAALRHHTHFLARQLRELSYVRIRAHDGNFDIAQ